MNQTSRPAPGQAPAHAAAQPSITSTESFRLLAQQADLYRVMVWAGLLMAFVVVTLVRHWLHGAVFANRLIFDATMVILLTGVAVQAGLGTALYRAHRAGVIIGWPYWRLSAVVDLGIPMLFLGLLSWHSPMGPVWALSAPAILLLPVVVLLSILRLRPGFTLSVGLIAAVFHMLLAVRAHWVENLPHNQWPVNLSYGVALLLTAVAGALVAAKVRVYVTTAADEAAARERVDRQLAAIQRDLSIARDIQAGLLPAQVPAFDGVTLAGMSRPADETGGDYYDWQQLPDGRLLVVLADVTGHGIGPALVMAVCRAYARASAAIISDPAPLMRRLNELLLADLPAGRFITLAVALLSPDGSVELVSAGHGPTLLCRAADAAITSFGGDGLPLGLMPDERYEPVARFTMHPGDVLLLLTDGFFEWQRQPDGEAFGIERLEQTLKANAARTPADLLTALDHAATTFAAGARQQDDVTAVVIKRG
jgi:serine phosphatase RsbU (regulator of sigma subunit)